MAREPKQARRRPRAPFARRRAPTPLPDPMLTALAIAADQARPSESEDAALYWLEVYARRRAAAGA